MKSIRWLRRPLWQAAAFHLLAARKGAGKGTYLAEFAVWILGQGESIVFISREDSYEIDVKPRLVAAGMHPDEECVYFLTGAFRLPQDAATLTRALGTIKPRVGMVVIDPVGSVIGKARTNDDGEIKQAIDCLNDLAHELDCCVIGVRNVTVKAIESGALAAVLGSTAWVDTPRAVVLIAEDDEDPMIRHAEIIAGNRGATGEGEMFRIELVNVAGLEEPVTRAEMLGPSKKSVDVLLSSQPRGRGGTKSHDARALILDILDAEGEQESDALDACVAQATGLTAPSVRKIRSELVRAGLLRNRSKRDAETKAITSWWVSRTKAPRPEELVSSRAPAKNPRRGNQEQVSLDSHSSSSSESIHDLKESSLDSRVPAREGIGSADCNQAPDGVSQSQAEDDDVERFLAQLTWEPPP